MASTVLFYSYGPFSLAATILTHPAKLVAGDVTAIGTGFGPPGTACNRRLDLRAGHSDRTRELAASETESFSSAIVGGACSPSCQGSRLHPRRSRRPPHTLRTKVTNRFGLLLGCLNKSNSADGSSFDWQSIVAFHMSITEAPLCCFGKSWRNTSDELKHSSFE